jgi:hypothetical protein
VGERWSASARAGPAPASSNASIRCQKAVKDSAFEPYTHGIGHVPALVGVIE